MKLLIAPLVALLCYVPLHWAGIGLDSDSWAAWQAAISILDGKGYSYFSGNPIHSWPPVYALYLAAWIKVLGPSAMTLMICNALLIAVQAVLWMHLARTVTIESGRRVSTGADIVLSVYVGMYLALYEQSAYAHYLVYTILPVFLLLVWRIVSRPEQPLTPRVMLVPVLLGIVLMLTHISSLAFLAAAAGVIALARRLSLRSLVAGAVLVVVPAVAWLIVQTLLDQGGSHHVGFGAGRFSPLFYARQLLDGPGSMMVPAKFGAQFVAPLLLWVAALAVARQRDTAGVRFAIGFVALSLAGLYVIYNMSWIYSTLAGRLVLFAPLILVSMTYLPAAAIRPRAANAAIAILIVALCYWTASWSLRQFTSSLEALEFPNNFVPSNAYLSRDYRSGPPVPGPRGLLIPPLDFEEPRGLRN